MSCKLFFTIFTIKFYLDETLERYIARVLAKTYAQTHEIDHKWDIDSVGKMNILRVILYWYESVLTINVI